MSQKLKDQSLSPEVQAAALGSRSELGTEAPTGDSADFDERIRLALNAAWEKKALDLTVLDLREIASFTDFFVIATGTNRRQVQAISDEVVEQLKRSGTRAARVEGYQTAEWILVDYGDFVVHVFDDKSRRFYDLERLWREGKRFNVSPPGPGIENLKSEISDFKSEISDLESAESDQPERDEPRSLTDL
jgi:ribosome-associated protein